ncbi:MAG: hypothetical protein US66_C0035G0005 [Candidatus Moranbacteria bacterium GW2011_GWD2_37_9]|nr:MAG: hypothetical protein US66_C0035G0005 [Candidatus Moranbacteria bacterium GW2011_GWD2_37_9]
MSKLEIESLKIYWKLPARPGEIEIWKFER